VGAAIKSEFNFGSWHSNDKYKNGVKKCKLEL
jgi:hypothetical protein